MPQLKPLILAVLIGCASMAQSMRAQTVRPFLTPLISGFDPSKFSATKIPVLDSFRARIKPTTLQAKSLVENMQAANRLVRDDADFVGHYVQVFSAAPEFIPDTGKFVPLAYVMLSLDIVSLERLLASIESLSAPPDTVTTNAARAEAKEIRDRLQARAGKVTTVALYADGAIRGAFDATNNATASAAGTGSIGLSVAYPKGWGLSASIGVAGTIDSVQSGFGGAVLVPGAGKGSLSNFTVEVQTPIINITVPFTHKQTHIKLPFSMYGYVAASNSKWVTIDSSGKKTAPITPWDTLRANAGVTAEGVGLRYQPVQGRLGTTEVGLAFTAGLAVRLVRDEVGAQPLALAAALNGHTNSTFWGGELGMELEIGTINGSVRYYSIRTGSGQQVRGLNGGVWAIGLSAAATVVSGALTKL